MMERKKHRITLIEPSAIVRKGFKHLISEHAEFEWADGFPDLKSFAHLQHIAGQIDVLLINPVTVDYEKRRNLRAAIPVPAHVPVLGFIYHYFASDILRQLDGIVEINDDPAVIIRTLRNALQGDRDGAAPTGENHDLSEREREILVAVAKGMTNKEIAETHHISVHTVISHRKNLTRKTGIKTISGLTVYALLNNLLDQAEI